MLLHPLVGGVHADECQPGGETKGGVGGCNMVNEALIAAPTADAKLPNLQYIVWTEDGNTWPSAW